MGKKTIFDDNKNKNARKYYDGVALVHKRSIQRSLLNNQLTFNTIIFFLDQD